MSASLKETNICIWNAQGIKNKKIELVKFLHDHDIDVMLISETFLKHNINFFVKGYHFHRKDRENQSKGGVGILAS